MKTYQGPELAEILVRMLDTHRRFSVPGGGRATPQEVLEVTTVTEKYLAKFEVALPCPDSEWRPVAVSLTDEENRELRRVLFV